MGNKGQPLFIVPFHICINSAYYKRIYVHHLNIGVFRAGLDIPVFLPAKSGIEREQDELKATADALHREVKRREQKKTDVRNFVTIAKKYTDLRELDAGVLREFVERIYISEKDKQTKTQEIRIVYNFIGAFDFTQVTEQSINGIITGEPGVA